MKAQVSKKSKWQNRQPQTILLQSFLLKNPAKKNRDHYLKLKEGK